MARRKDTSRCERGRSQAQGTERMLSTDEQLKVQEGKELTRMCCLGMSGFKPRWSGSVYSSLMNLDDGREEEVCKE